jgi:hypothetical protein
VKFTKRIVKPGVYFARAFDGSRKPADISLSRMNQVVDTFNDMKTAGLKVPAPWWHDPDSKPFDGQAQPLTAKDNAGEWEKLWIEKDEKGTPWLTGIVDVPLPEDAAKVGTTVQEVSPAIIDYTDGLNRQWKDAPIHIALVNHPVVPNQPNFKPLPNTNPLATALAMSLSDILLAYSNEGKAPEVESKSKSTDEAGNNTGSPRTGSALKDVVAALKALDPPVDLGDDCTLDNILERIVVACRAIKSHDHAGDDEESTPREQPTPIAMDLLMSNLPTLTNEIIAAELVPEPELFDSLGRMLKPVSLPGKPAPDPTNPFNSPLFANLNDPSNPDTFTLGNAPSPASQTGIAMSLTPEQQQAQAALNYAAKAARENYGRRILALVQSRRVTPHYAKTHLEPLYNGFQLSLDPKTHEPVKSSLDEILLALESLPVNQSIPGAKPQPGAGNPAYTGNPRYDAQLALLRGQAPGHQPAAPQETLMGAYFFPPNAQVSGVEQEYPYGNPDEVSEDPAELDKMLGSLPGYVRMPGA